MLTTAMVASLICLAVVSAYYGQRVWRADRYGHLGNMVFYQQDARMAEYWWERAASGMPWEQRFAEQRIRALLVQKQYAKALSLTEVSLTYFPYLLPLHLYKAQAELMLGRPHDALVSYFHIQQNFPYYRDMAEVNEIIRELRPK